MGCSGSKVHTNESNLNSPNESAAVTKDEYVENQDEQKIEAELDDNQNTDEVLDKKSVASKTPLSSPKKISKIANREETSEQAEKDAVALHDVCISTDDSHVSELLNILGPISHEYRQIICNVYKENYNEELMSKMIVNKDFDAENALQQLIRSNEIFLIHAMQQSIKNHDFITMVELLTAWSANDMKEAKSLYKQEYHVAFHEDVSSSLTDKISNEVKSIIKNLTSLQRDDESKEVDENLSNEECEELSLGGKSIVEMLTMKPYNIPQLASIFKIYKEKCFLDITDSIEIEFQDEVEAILQAIVDIVQNTPLHFAKQIKDALSKRPINKDRISFLIIGRFSVDYMEIEKAYTEIANCSLSLDIENNLKDYLKDLFLMILERSKRI